MPPMTPAIIIVDHGSRRAESNEMLEHLAGMFAARFAARHPIVEPAHMEIAEPSIGTAYDRCVARGGQRIICCPFFLGPGKHWTSDIPRLMAAAAGRHPHTAYHVTPYLGIDDLLLELLDKRIRGCEDHAFSCEMCRGTLRSGEKGIATLGE
jgi:sirohydrochlorin ferrochelatase